MEERGGEEEKRTGREGAERQREWGEGERGDGAQREWREVERERESERKTNRDRDNKAERD